MYNLLMHLVTAIGLLGCGVFVATYWVRTGGAALRSDIGRFFIIVYANFALLLAYLMFGIVYFDVTGHPWTGTRWVGLALYTSFAIETWWPLRLLWNADESNKRVEKKGG